MRKNAAADFHFQPYVVQKFAPLPSKRCELSALPQYDGDYNKIYGKTWLTEEMTDIDIQGDTTTPFDRDRQKTARSIGGVLCLF